METALRYDAKIAGPIPLPTEIKKYTVNRSTFVYKDAREILTLREVGGLTYDEIAGQLNCSIDAVKSRLKRARQELQQKARHFLGSSNVQ
jgi:transcriptional regulator